MSRNIIFSGERGGSGTVKSDLTVPSQNRDVRLVAESDPKPRLLKGKSFRVMAKDTKANQTPRPARKIKLNRSIFNAGFQGKPSFRVKTLDEIKSERKEPKETATVSTQPNVNNTVNNYTATNAVKAVTDNNISVDTRKVLKSEPAKRCMLLPTIQLTRINSGKYSRSIAKSENPGNVRRIIKSENALRRFKTLDETNRTDDAETMKQQTERSPVKKRKISPIRSPDREPELKRLFVNTTCSQSVLTTSQERPPSPLVGPPSPALSLGAQSDHELDGEPETISDARMVIRTGSELRDDKPDKGCIVSRDFVVPSHSGLNQRLGTSAHSHFLVPTSVGVNTSFDDDKLDVMSIMAEDDELFCDEKPRTTLKRSLSQDSVFGMVENSTNCGDLRSLLHKTDSGSTKKHSVGDLISSKSVSKNYKIPYVNQSSGKILANDFAGGRKGPTFQHENLDNRPGRLLDGPRRNTTGNSHSKVFPRRGDTSEARHRGGTISSQGFSHDHPQRSGVETKAGYPTVNRFFAQEHLQMHNGIKFNLGRRNVSEAWECIKKLDQMKGAIDVRLLEETLKICERVSSVNANPALGNIAVGAFEMIKRLGHVKPTDFIMIILTLSRCQRIQEASNYYQAMKLSRKFPPEEVLELFVSDLCKCLVVAPSKIIEVILDVTGFQFPPRRQANLVNSCVAFLISSPLLKLREINAQQWNLLFVVLCSPPTSNIQSAVQVQNFMEKNSIPLSPSATMQLFKFYKESKSTKPLLSLLCSKATKEILAMQKPPVDVGRFLMSPTVNVRDIEECFAGLLKEGTMPSEELLHHFIVKASVGENYNVIYQFFLKCEKSLLSLPVSTLKQMMDALENWDENADASVQVYATLRQARKTSNKKPAAPVHDTARKDELPKKSNRFRSRGVCFNFLRFGSCIRGDKCHFSHAKDDHHQYSGRESEHSERDSVGEGHGSEDSGKSVEKSASSNPPFNPRGASPVENHCHSINNALLNGVNHNPATVVRPFPAFQIFPPVFGPKVFNPQLFNKLRADRPPFKPVFQRNAANHMPRFGGPGVQPHCPQGLLDIRPRPPLGRHSSEPPVFPPTTKNCRVGRSFSWEPASNVKPNPSDSQKSQKLRNNLGVNDSNNNGTMVHSLPHRVEMAIKSKEWETVYACYIECKGPSSQGVKSEDLQIFRNGFLKDISGSIGHNFSAFLKFLYKENNSGRSCHSNQSDVDVFDQYDVEFIGAVGVSLLEKCLVLKLFEDGYEVLLALHSHNISYFQSGRNFGAYTKDIPPPNVALIAVKLCLGISKHGILGAMEVLRACNYAIADDGELLSAQEEEYRIKVLHQLLLELFDEGHVPEAYEVIQNLNASPNFVGPLYIKVLGHYVAEDDFDKSFSVLAEMQGKGLELNIPPCHLLYEKFLRYCVATQNCNQAVEALTEIASKGISMNVGVLRDILNDMLTSEDNTMTNQLFEKCTDLDIYPRTFCRDTPWLCELGCGYSQAELKLLILKHLEKLHKHLLCASVSDQLILDVKELQIVLFPRLSGDNAKLKFSNGIQTTLAKNGLVVERVLKEDLNPPLTILKQSGEQFHKKIIVEKMSIYRWFSANKHIGSQGLVDNQAEDEMSSQESVGSDISALTDFA